MKKLVAALIAAILLVIALLIIAFLYIDLSGHRNFAYEVFVGERLFGSVKVDRYVTENKIVYKSSLIYPYSPEYPSISEKLFLNKWTMMPLKFTQEAVGSRGQKRIISLVQAREKTDFLFLEHPRYIALKGFETGEKTMVFSPNDIMSYMPVMEKYNFWKKGVQFFEIMVPPTEPIPPMREKIEVKYLSDEYIPVMGRRVEAECYSLSARGIPEARVFLSKYGHRVLALELEKEKMRFNLVGYIEGPGKRLKPLMKKVSVFLDTIKAGKKSLEQDEVKREGIIEKFSLADKSQRNDDGSEEVFFESDNLIFSGKLWYPTTGDGPFPAALMVSSDGPTTAGERSMLEAMGKGLSEDGFVALLFDSPGQGKSQGSFSGLGDEKRTNDVKAAIDFLTQQPSVMKSAINLIGYGGGGYIALRAASEVPDVRSCVVVGLPSGFEKNVLFHDTPQKDIQKLLDEQGIGPFDDKFMETVAVMVRTHLEKVTGSDEDISYFLGVTVPVKEYREFIERKPYEAMISFNRPLLLVLGRDDMCFDPKVVDRLEKTLKETNKANKVAVFRNLGPYMGEMVEKGTVWSFAINSDVVRLINTWVHDNGTLPKPVPVASADQQTAS
jgi:alpha/beta superfamily hydrolase